MKTVRVSKKFQVFIPLELRKAANVKPGDEMAALVKHGILEYVHVRPIAETKGMFKGVDSDGLRDEHERVL